MKLFNNLLYLNCISITTSINCMEEKEKIQKVNIKKIQKVSIKKIKCDFFVRNLFKDLILENRKLNIMKFNRDLQKKVKVKLEDYKKYQNVCHIIAESDNEDDFAKIKENLKTEEFLNNENSNIIYKKGLNKIFNGLLVSNGKKLCDTIRIFEKVKKLTIKTNIETKSLEYMFSGFLNLEEIDLSKFNTKYVENMSCMFIGCNNLKKANLSNLNADNVIHMSYMFDNCYNITDINFSNFTTKKLIYTKYMFQDCNSLKNIDLSSFNTYKIDDMSNMFINCHNLKTVNLMNFQSNKNTFCYDIFKNCKNIVYVIANNELLEKFKKQLDDTQNFQIKNGMLIKPN